MNLLHKSRLTVKLGEYSVGQSTALVDPNLVARAQDYRRQTASKMIPLDPEDILKRFPPATYRVSLKIDGEFSILAYHSGEACLVNPGGTVRTGLPLLKEACDLLKKAGITQAIFAGELHYMRTDGKRARVHDVSRIARQPNSQAELDQLGFAAFDIIETDEVLPEGGYEKTWKRLAELFGKGKRCNIVEAVVKKDAADIEAQFREWVNQGAEGAVVRSDEVGTFKLKPRHTLDAVVIGFTEGTDDRKGMIHDLLVAVMRQDGCLHVLGHVGGGFSNDDRRGFLSDLKDMICASDYVEVNEQVAYHMVRPEWIVEISFLDLIAQTTRGLSINRMVLNWNPGTRKYEIVRRLPLVGVISPQFVRRREDKTLNQHDIRIQQVTDIVEVSLTDRDARQLNLPRSLVLKREVWTKVMKGNTMVRKLVLWQTNKEKESEDFPAYVVHFTDFSPNRKTPLERDIRVSNSLDQIQALWKELADENFGKGWTPAVTAGSVPGKAVAETITAVAESPPAAPKRARKAKAEPEATPAVPEATPEPAKEVAPAPKPAAKKRTPKKKSDEE